MRKGRKRKMSAKKEDKPLINIGQWKDRPFRKYSRALFMLSTGYTKKKDMYLFSDDISIGGVFLETADPLPPGTDVKLRFPLRSPYKPIQVQGRVVWNRRGFAYGRLGNKNPGMGIAFKKIAEKDLSALNEFLDHTHTHGWFL